MKNIIALLGFMLFLGMATWPVEADTSPPSQEAIHSDSDLCTGCAQVMDLKYEVPVPHGDPSMEYAVHTAAARAVKTDFPETKTVRERHAHIRIDKYYDPGPSAQAMGGNNKTDSLA